MLFISHATKDDAQVNIIADALDAAGIATWVDHRKGILAGDRFNRVIQAATEEASAGIFAMSSASVNSDYCEAEWTRLLQLNKRLYVILLEKLDFKAIPLPLSPISWVNYARDGEAALQELINAIHAQRQVDPTAPVSGQSFPLNGPLPRHHLDLPLIGRDADKTAIQNALVQHRAVLIRGLGGVGKTRLAVELATTLAEQFPAGVIWHELNEFASVEKLSLQVRDLLHLPHDTPTEAIWQALSKVAVLMVLDNAETCPSPDAYAQILNQIPLEGGTRILLTSRLGMPALKHSVDHELRAPTPAAALSIFQEMLRLDPPQFPLEAEAAAITQAAHYHPRLMEYAVKWGKQFPASHILQTLQTLKSRNAQAALDEMVNKTVEQVRQLPYGDSAIQALRRLAVCRGGFAYEAAVSLIDEAEDMGLLVDWGLLRIIDGRYEIDALVMAAVGEDENARPAHFETYAELVNTLSERQDYASLELEAANLEAAFAWQLRQDAAKAFWFQVACDAFLRNRGRYAQSLAWLHQLAAALIQTPDKALWSAMQNSLGIAWQHLPSGKRSGNLHSAIAAYQEALQYRQLETQPLDYAMTQTNLGEAHRLMATLSGHQAHLPAALHAYQEALRFFTPESAPSAYATVQLNLGNLYRLYANIEKPAEYLQKALEAYQNALPFYPPSNAPLDYAAVQNNLGVIYGALAKLSQPIEHYQRAIEAYQAALEYRTPANAPFEYAATQNNLGTCYAALADYQDASANLQRAIEAYQAALEFRRPDADPLDYIGTLNNLGGVYYHRGRLTQNSADLKQALALYQDALPYLNANDAPMYAAVTQINLGNAYQSLAAFEAQAQNLEHAIAAYEVALQIYTAESAPLDYAMVQHNMAAAWHDYAQVADPLTHFERAIAGYQEALRFRSPEQTPFDYALTQNNLANSLASVARLQNDVTQMQAAEAACREALRFYTAETAPSAFVMTERNHGMILVELGRLAEAIGVWQVAADVAEGYGDAASAQLMRGNAAEVQAFLDGGG